MQKSSDNYPHILMLIDAWFPHVGGGQVHAWEIAKNLASFGCKVTILTRDLGEWQQSYPGVEVIRIGTEKDFANIKGRISYLIEALKFSLTYDYDILHAHAFSPGLIAPFAKFIKNKKTVFTAHGKGVKVAGLNMSLSFLEDLVIYKLPYDFEISVAKNTLIKKTRAKELAIIPNGVNISDFKKAIRVRKKINKILFVGRLSKEKGVDLLIKSFNSYFDSLNLTIVGEGSEYKSLKKMSKKNKVKFRGKLVSEELIKEFRNADLLVIPSRTEGHPLVLFEGWASKLPVLATRVGDNPRYIKEKINGFLADPSVESISQSLNNILNYNKIDQVTENAFKEVQKYSWEKIGKKTLNVYQRILK